MNEQKNGLISIILIVVIIGLIGYLGINFDKIFNINDCKIGNIFEVMIILLFESGYL